MSAGVFKGIVFWAGQCDSLSSDLCDTHQPFLKVLVVSLCRFQEALIKVYAIVVFFETYEKLRYCKGLAGWICSRNTNLFSSGRTIDERSPWTLQA